MTAVGEWLRQIVLIVMFAVVADLLLPNKEMQRYVRMVLGLAVIAAMLQPLHMIVQTGWSDRLAGAAASEVLAGNSNDASSASVSQFESVLQSEQTAQTNRYLASTLKADIASKFQAHVSSVQITGAPGDASFAVTVTITDAPGEAKQIQDFVATAMALPKQRVTVKTGEEAE